MGGQGLRVLAFAARIVEEAELEQMQSRSDVPDEWALLIGLVGIIDPLRAEAKAAVATALRAGIEVRMITGDHAVTAAAIGRSLGLGPGPSAARDAQTHRRGSWRHGCRSCTCSDAFHPRTNYVWRRSCSIPARSWP